jgi:hypothetical protein
MKMIFIQMLKVLFNNDNMDQFRLNKYLDMFFFHSFEIHGCHSIRISDDTMQSVAEPVLDYNHYLSLIVEQYQRLD